MMLSYTYDRRLCIVWSLIPFPLMSGRQVKLSDSTKK